MADGGSDDDVIHLASFNVHRSQGETHLLYAHSRAYVEHNPTPKLSFTVHSIRGSVCLSLIISNNAF